MSAEPETQSAKTLHLLLLTLAVGSLLYLAGIMDVDRLWILTSCSFLHPGKIPEECSYLPSLGQVPAMGRVPLQVVTVGESQEGEP